MAQSIKWIFNSQYGYLKSDLNSTYHSYIQLRSLKLSQCMLNIMYNTYLKIYKNLIIGNCIIKITYIYKSKYS